MAAQPNKITKRRALPYVGAATGTLTDIWVDELRVPPVQVSTSSATINTARLQGSQVTVSENHPNWRSRIRGSADDVGGYFFTQKRWVEGQALHASRAVRIPVNNRQWHTWVFDGPVLPCSPFLMQWPDYFPSSDATLDAFGAKLVDSAKPTNSIVDLSTALSELYHEGLPKAIGVTSWESRASAAKTAGKEYLNTEFGWQPLKKDIEDFIHGVYNAERIIKQYERDAGKVVRRKASFPPITTQSSNVISNGDAVYMIPTSSALTKSPVIGQVVLTSTRETRRWFSGAFTYYIPSDGYARGVIREYSEMADHILGLTITPEVLWNLAPWSWAADWFFNFGSVLSNVSSWQKDGLVMQYGYVMEHTIAKNTYTHIGPSGFIFEGLNAPAISLVSETKVRRKANPFGFGLIWSGLSSRQLAIAAALGITRR